MIKKISLLIMVILLSFLVFIPTSFADLNDTFKKERLIIIFKTEIDNELLHNVNAEVHHRYDLFPAVSASVPVSEINRLHESPNVISVDKDIKVTVDSQIIDYGIPLTITDKSKSIGLTGKGVRVAVVDSGISTSHPDLNVVGGGSFVDNNPSYNDDFGHGTHVAGIIAAQNNEIGTVGVAPGVSLFALKALDGDSGDASAVMAAIEWSIQNNMDIINLSLSSISNYWPLEIMINIAYDNGILVVAAAGNSGGFVEYPAKYSNAIAVGAINQTKSLWEYSSIGPEIELVAPGVNVLSSFTSNGSDSYAKMTGTSMAVPHVVGILALYKEAYPELTISELRNLVQQKSVDLGVKGKDIFYGYGIAQAPVSTFWDLSASYIFVNHINYLVSQNIINGYADGSFKPNRTVTRSEAAKIIGEMLGVNSSKRDTKFTDVSEENFASGYIQELVDQNIISGYGDGTFKPNDYITRAEMAIIVCKAFKLVNMESINYKDVSKSMASYDSIRKIQAAGITEGYDDNSFRPYSLITRGQFSAFIARGLNNEFKIY